MAILNEYEIYERNLLRKKEILNELSMNYSLLVDEKICGNLLVDFY